MRHDKITAAPDSKLRARIFTCACCETTEHRLTERLPFGWAVEVIDGREYAFCEACKIDLPEEHRHAGAMATRLGVASQLDAAELLDMDEEDWRHAHRIAGIARAERVGRHVFPLLLYAIALIGSASVVQHGVRWISM